LAGGAEVGFPLRTHRSRSAIVLELLEPAGTGFPLMERAAAFGLSGEIALRSSRLTRFAGQILLRSGLTRPARRILLRS
jgi:hypothetical protein